MNHKSKLPRMLMALAVFIGWKAQAEIRALSKEEYFRARIPTGVATELAKREILLLGQGDNLCFDFGGAYDKANGDRDLLLWVEELRQITAGNSVVTNCEPGAMPAGVQAVGAQ